MEVAAGASSEETVAVDIPVTWKVAARSRYLTPDVEVPSSAI